MKKILVVQSRVTELRIERERENFRRAIGTAADTEFISALDEGLAWTTPDELLKGFDGVIFGGSADFDFHGGRPEGDPIRLTSMIILSRVKNIISYAFAENVPILGVCFGHQIIGQMYGGMVSNDREQSKFGAYPVRLTEAGKTDPLFSKLPEEFFAQYAHKDSVTDIPQGAILLATGSACRFSVLRYGTTVYTVQFHPEVQRFIPGPDSHDSPEASTLIQLWTKHIVSA